MADTVNRAVEEGREPIYQSRMYENEFPGVDDLVMVQVKAIEEMGAHVTLLEYNHIEGMIFTGEVSRRRIRSMNKLLKVGKQEIVQVLKVDTAKRYIDLSKKRVSTEDIAACEARWNKSKIVHSIMRQTAKKAGWDTLQLYEMFGFEMYRQFPHAQQALKLAISDREAFVKMFPMPTELHPHLFANIERRLTPTVAKIRAEISVSCIGPEGIEAIKRALSAGLAVDADGDVSIKLIRPPNFVVTTSTMEPQEGIELLTQVAAAISSAIEKEHGSFLLKKPPQAVTHRDDQPYLELMDASTSGQGAVGGA